MTSERLCVYGGEVLDKGVLVVVVYESMCYLVAHGSTDHALPPRDAAHQGVLCDLRVLRVREVVLVVYLIKTIGGYQDTRLRPGGQPLGSIH